MDKAKKIIIENAIQALQAVLKILSIDSENITVSEDTLSLNGYYDMNNLKEDIIHVYNSQIEHISYKDIAKDLSNLIDTKINVLNAWMSKEKGESWTKIPIELRYNNIRKTVNNNMEYIVRGIQSKYSRRGKLWQKIKKHGSGLTRMN